jgi:hypothetical protein
MRTGGTVALLLVLFGAGTVRAGEEIPFPVRASTSANADDAVYYVEGRQRIDMGTCINVRQGIRVVGRGDDATLEIAGELVCEGQPRQEITLENLRLELCERFQSVRLEWVHLVNCRIEVPKESTVSGRLTIDSSVVDGSIRVNFYDGEIRFLNSEFKGSVELNGVPWKGKDASAVEVQILDCSGRDDKLDINPGIRGGLVIASVPDVTVRGSWIDGARTEFVDCRTVKFDGNTVLGGITCFRQTASGNFKRTKISKCDFYEGRVVLEAPRDGKDKVVVDKCWFRGLTRKSDILQQALSDGTTDEKSGANALFRKINERPLGIGGIPVR